MTLQGRRELSDRQWARLEEILETVLAIPPNEREARLDEMCAGDDVLRAELKALLAAHDKEGLLDRPFAWLTPHADAVQAHFSPGSVVSHYEILEPLGSGGMGIVYRARDLRLNRTVALKFLPPRLSGDAHAKQRFLTEARAAAALEHINVCTVHEIGETDDGQLFIAMALVSGESLNDVIARGPIDIATALNIARQVALGLECAHSHGVVHRDVKPANIIVGADGIVKLVDFGVAKLAESTLTNPSATPGTVAYMSPEQARGENVDHRADVWALGVVLYEMLAGRRPFRGQTDAIVLHAITDDVAPPLSALRADIPEDVEVIVARALEKTRKERFESARSFHDALPGGASTPAKPVMRRRGLGSLGKMVVVAGVVLAIAGASWLWLGAKKQVAGEMLRVSIAAPGAVTPQLSAAISPNGKQVAFVATDPTGEALLWVRALDQLEARPVRGTEHAAHPFWAPDGRSLGFIADNQIKRIDLASGSVQTIVDNVVRYGPAWGADGTILFSQRADRLAAVPATGGPVRTILDADSTKRQTALYWPRFLPDGRHFIYFALSDQPEYQGIYVGSLDSKETRLLFQSDFKAWYAPPGYLVFARDETLYAQPFDVERLQLRGEPVAVAHGVWFARPAGQASFSVSETGALAYVNATLWDAELLWFDRTGRPVGIAGAPTRHEGLTPQISPDGRSIAVGRGEFGRQQVWILGASGNDATRLSFDHTEGGTVPVWAGDSRRLMYEADGRLMVKGVTNGTEEVVLESLPGELQDWSRDGRHVVFQKQVSRSDLWAVAIAGDRVAFPLTETPWNEAQAQLSPNGAWIAYTSNESGRDEVYLQSFPVAGRKRRVSTGGGAMPRWRRDGRELFYLAGNQVLTAVPISDPASLELGRPQPLFRTRLVVEGSESIGLPTRYAVAPNGDRFLLRYPPADPGPPITVVINWTSALAK